MVRMAEQMADLLEKGLGARREARTATRPRLQRVLIKSGRVRILIRAFFARGFFDFANGVRLDPANDTALAAAPKHFDGQLLVRFTRGENADGIVAGQISSATKDLLHLHRHGSAKNADHRADPL